MHATGSDNLPEDDVTVGKAARDMAIGNMNVIKYVPSCFGENLVKVLRLIK